MVAQHPYQGTASAVPSFDTVTVRPEPRPLVRVARSEGKSTTPASFARHILPPLSFKERMQPPDIRLARTALLNQAVRRAVPFRRLQP